MTNRNYVLSHAAENDILNIWNYIADDNPQAADRFIDKMLSTMQTLADTPHIGRVRDELRTGYRSFPVGNYVLFYRIEHEAIHIMHVLHGRRDIANFQF